MNNETKSFLEGCNLSHLYPIFAENKIDDISLLPLLSEEEVKELIPLLEERKKFQIALLALKLNTTDSGIILDKNINLLNLPLSEEDIEVAEISQNINVDSKLINEPPAKRQKVSLSVPEWSESDAVSTSSVSSLSIICDEEDIYMNETNNDELVTNILKTSDVVNFDLKNLLQNNIIGRAILLKYQKTKSIDNKDRNNLCDIIVCHFLNEGKRLNNSTISILTDKIVEIFDGERRSTYYVSPIGKRKSRHNKPEIARGKLIDKHRNKLNFIRKSSTTSKISTITRNPVSDISKEVQDSQIWLKHNNEPQEEVISHWKLSYPIRKIANSSLTKFFNEWPILKTQAAIDLISYDFQQKFQLEEDYNINNKFEDFFNYVYDKRKAFLKPSDVSLYHLLEDEITTDSKIAIRLFLLSSLVPPRHRAKTGKTFWKPSVSEARDGLMLQVKIPGDIESSKSEKTDFMYKKGLTVQPYIIIVGPTLTNVHAFYVVIENINYQMNTLLDALKFCFQTYFVLDVKYPSESQHLWYLLQWELFNITSDKDIQIPFINDILKFKK